MTLVKDKEKLSLALILALIDREVPLAKLTIRGEDELLVIRVESRTK